MNARFAESLESVLAHETDRRILLKLHEARREVRYEELRRTVSEPHSQKFKRAFDRLMHHALINRRLDPQGDRYDSYLSPTPRGLMIANLLIMMTKALERDAPKEYAAQAMRVLRGETSRGNADEDEHAPVAPV